MQVTLDLPTAEELKAILSDDQEKGPNEFGATFKAVTLHGVPVFVHPGLPEGAFFVHPDTLGKLEEVLS